MSFPNRNSQEEEIGSALLDVDSMVRLRQTMEGPLDGTNRTFFIPNGQSAYGNMIVVFTEEGITYSIDSPNQVTLDRVPKSLPTCSYISY